MLQASISFCWSRLSGSWLQTLPISASTPTVLPLCGSVPMCLARFPQTCLALVPQFLQVPDQPSGTSVQATDRIRDLQRDTAAALVPGAAAQAPRGLLTVVVAWRASVRCGQAVPPAGPSACHSPGPRSPWGGRIWLPGRLHASAQDLPGAGPFGNDFVYVVQVRALRETPAVPAQGQRDGDVLCGWRGATQGPPELGTVLPGALGRTSEPAP